MCTVVLSDGSFENCVGKHEIRNIKGTIQLDFFPGFFFDALQVIFCIYSTNLEKCEIHQDSRELQGSHRRICRRTAAESYKDRHVTSGAFA